MSRRVTIELKVKLVAEVEEGIEASEVVQELDYSFTDQTGSATILDTQILDHEVTDSK